VASEYDRLRHPGDGSHGVSYEEAVESLRMIAGIKVDLDVVETLANLRFIDLRQLQALGVASIHTELATAAIN
jgi:hypothetical protein